MPKLRFGLFAHRRSLASDSHQSQTRALLDRLGAASYCIADPDALFFGKSATSVRRRALRDDFRTLLLASLGCGHLRNLLGGLLLALHRSAQIGAMLVGESW